MLVRLQVVDSNRGSIVLAPQFRDAPDEVMAGLLVRLYWIRMLGLGNGGVGG